MNDLDVPDLGTVGMRLLTKRLAKLEGRAEGRLMTHEEIAEKRELDKAIGELNALLAARERPAGNALDVVRNQIAELDAAGSRRDCLNPDDILALAARERLP